MKATKDMLILDLLQLDENIAGLLMGFGMHCIGCMLATNETIEQACMAHGIDADELIDHVNAYLEEAKSDPAAE